METVINTPWESGTITLDSGPLDDGSFCVTVKSSNPPHACDGRHGFPVLSLNLAATHELIAYLQAAVNSFGEPSPKRLEGKPS